MTVPQLARLRGTSRQNIQVLVNSLLRDTWITTRHNPAHRSSDFLVLTDKAQTTVPSFGEAEGHWQAAVLADSELRTELQAVTQRLENVRKKLTERLAIVAETEQHQHAPKPDTAGRKTAPAVTLAAPEELPVNLL
jgi:DNA-binding MarR family transcriptional regulator